MTAIKAKTFHKYQKQLFLMIKGLEKMRVECCDTGQCDARDDLGETISALYMAQAKGGKVKMKDADGNEVVALDGGGPGGK